MKKLYPILCLGALALASCQEESTEPEADVHQREIEEWQARAEAEFQKRQETEVQLLSASARAQTMEKAVLATGVAAVGLLVLGGAMGSKARKDAVKS
jgi:hypothetical protein